MNIQALAGATMRDDDAPPLLAIVHRHKDRARRVGDGDVRHPVRLTQAHAAGKGNAGRADSTSA